MTADADADDVKTATQPANISPAWTWKAVTTADADADDVDVKAAT